MTKAEEKCIDCMIENNVSFEQIIRCFNMWTSLKMFQREELIDKYQRGVLPNIGGRQ